MTPSPVVLEEAKEKSAVEKMLRRHKRKIISCSILAAAFAIIVALGLVCI